MNFNILITIINDFIVKNSIVSFISLFTEIFKQCNDNEINDINTLFKNLQNNKDLILVQLYLKFNEIENNLKDVTDFNKKIEIITKCCSSEKLNIQQLNFILSLIESNKRSIDESSSDEDDLLFVANTHHKEEKVKKNVEFSLFKKHDGRNLRWLSENGNIGKYYIDLKISSDPKSLKKIDKEERWKQCDIMIKGVIGSTLNKNDEGNILVKSIVKYCHDTVIGLPDTEFKETKVYNYNNPNKKKK